MERDDIFQEDTSNRSPLALDQETLLDDQFRIGRVLGVGGFGITYLAFDEVLEMVVAVKEYLPNNIAVRKTDGHTVKPLSSGDGQQDFEYGLERFLQEARTLAKFERHPNIVRVRTFFQENGTGYLVMNFYEGRTLAEYLQVRNGFIPEQEALLIVDQVLEGLGAVHEEGILHRDIDPNNVYLADDGTVVLLDFGAARTAVGERTQSMSVVLKRGYAPHEQYHSYGDQGPWTDVYASAATMYRALTGYKPPEAAARILEDDLAPPVELVPSLSDATNEAIIEGLSVRADDRPQTVDEFAALLPSPGDADPHWIGEDTTIETAAGTSDGAAELQVTASHACRLYVDGRRTAELPAEERFTVSVEPGSHRLRAVRTDQESNGNATVTASESDIEPGAEDGGRFSLDALVWQDVVSASGDAPTTVDIDFEEDRGASTTTAATEAVEEPVAEDDAGETAMTESDTTPVSATEGTPVQEEEEPPDSGASSSAPDSESSADDEPDADPAAPATLRVEVDRAGTLLIDGDAHGTVRPDEDREIEVAPGEHEVRVEAEDGSVIGPAVVDIASGASRTVSISGDAAKQGRAAGVLGLGRGTLIAGGVGAVCVLLFAGWIALGHRVPGPDPSTVGERIVPGEEAVLDAGRAVLDGGQSVARRGVAAVGRGATSALVWMGLYNRRPKPRPDRLVTTQEALINVRANDRDPEGEPLNVTAAGPIPDSVAHVSVVDSAHLRLRPASAFAGSVDVPYVVADLHGHTDSSIVTLQVPFSGSARRVTDDVEQPQVVRTDSLGDDGDLDVLIASLGDQAVSWSENDLVGRDTFQTPRPIETGLKGAVDIHTADLNGNGKRDVLAASLKDDAVAWYENKGGGEFRSAEYLTTEADGAVAVRTMDVDLDGTQDVVVGSLLDESVAWYENEGDGEFSEEKVFATGIKGLETLQVTNLDADSVSDVLVVSYQDSTIARYEPEGHDVDSVHFERRPPIGTHLREPIEVHTADLLGNDRPDVMAGKAGIESLVLFENRVTAASTLTFGNKRVLTSALKTVEAIETGDLDQDGDEDIVAASFDEGKIVWFKNRGDGSFGSAQPIATNIPNVITLEVADVDQDDDLDVISASQAENSVVWYENHIR